MLGSTAGRSIPTIQPIGRGENSSGALAPSQVRLAMALAAQDLALERRRVLVAAGMMKIELLARATTLAIAGA
jgi:hypothetical protein